MAEIIADKISFRKDNTWYSLENKLYCVPYQVLKLNTNSTSSEILNAFGGQDKFVDCVNHLFDGALAYSIDKHDLLIDTFFISVYFGKVGGNNAYITFTYIDGNVLCQIQLKYDLNTMGNLEITKRNAQNLFLPA